MSSPTKRSDSGIPVGRLLIILSVFAIPGLIYLGVFRIAGRVKIVDIPIVGEWQAPDKTWRIVFRPDKTLVSSTSSFATECFASMDFGSGHVLGGLFRHVVGKAEQWQDLLGGLDRGESQPVRPH